MTEGEKRERKKKTTTKGEGERAMNGPEEG